MKGYSIETIKNYPNDGKHQECITTLPFEIRKGEDGYVYTDNNGVRKKYNMFKTEGKIDERWICHLAGYTNQSLEEIFSIKVDKNLDVILKHCYKLYKTSLEMELLRIKNEYTNLIC